jgi:two-component system sensor histidine kinase BaeS
MTEPLRSLRVWLLLAMLATAAVTILVGNFVIGRINASSEVEADRAKALTIANAIAAQMHGGAPTPDLRLLQRALPNDQIVVLRDGRTIFTGPSRSSYPLAVTVTAPFPSGKVNLRDHHAPDTGGLAQATLVAGTIAVLVMGEAWLGTTLIMRTVRGPLRRAIETADRVAAGDLSARMGESGPEEFARLGHALDSMAAQLQHADAEQRRFLADLAHEIATPVSAVTGFAVALADGSAATPTERAEAAQLVVRESDRLQRLLDDVRSLNRLELAESTRREQIDVAELCADAANRYRPAAQRAAVTLRVEARHACVTADPRLVEAVVNNLVANAVRYTPAGGTVEIRVRKRRATVVVTVRDTGIGIAPEHLQRIFDRLYRVDEARDRATGGSGLGLAIARRAAQSLGGRIEVDSTPGVGSEFRLVLPLRPPVATPAPSGAAGSERGDPADASV